MIATLAIETALRDDKTILKKCFCTSPFKVLDITENRQDATLQLMLMNVSPGVLDGDDYKIDITAAAGCLLQLHTQSYQRLFQMKHGASQHLKLTLEAGSTLCFLPHPSVPHNGADFTSKNSIFLSQNCTLIWSEVFTCGRKGSGEAFQFSKYHNQTEIFWNGRLMIKENLLLQPHLMNVTGIGQLEGFTHQASFIYLDEHAAVPATMNEFYECLLHEKNICFGITALPVNGFIIRMLGHKGEQLHGLLKKFAAQLMKKAAAQPIEQIKASAYAD